MQTLTTHIHGLQSSSYLHNNVGVVTSSSLVFLSIDTGKEMNPQQYATINPIAAHLFPEACIQHFDLSREQLLTLPMQVFNVAGQVTRSATFSAYRVRWNTLHAWDDFGTLVTEYWANTVSEEDKAALIEYRTSLNNVYNRAAGAIVSTEEHVKQAIYSQPVAFHQTATTSLLGQPSPSDAHSQIEYYPARLGLAGWADFVFCDAQRTRVTAVMEGKNPWRITPAQINEVLNDSFSQPDFLLIKGTADVSGDHPDRLAVEQVYGYMIRNSVPFGIITTMCGWVFLRCEDGGQLFMTPMFGCHPNLIGGYTNPEVFTIMLALYHFSALAESSPALHETTRGQPGRVQIDSAATQIPAPAPTIQITQNIQFVHYNPSQQPDQMLDQQFVLRNSEKDLTLIFESWKRETQLGLRLGAARCCQMKMLSLKFGIHGSATIQSEIMRSMFTCICNPCGARLFPLSSRLDLSIFFMA
jgi:hypothetical protein